MKKGRSLELLVEALEKNLSNDPSLLIESPKRILDNHTGRLREHDVLLTFNSSHHNPQIAIECRDRSRPVGVLDIEAFENKCRCTNINNGVIVSSSGFCNTAKEKANKMGIRCIELNDIDKTDFLAPDASVVMHVNNCLTAIYTPISHTNPRYYLNDYCIYSPEGLLITDEILIDNLRTIGHLLPSGKLGEKTTEIIKFKADGYYIVEPNNNKKLPIDSLMLTVTYIPEIRESKLRAREYKDINDTNVLATVATASVVLDGEEKEFTVINNNNETSMQFISKKP